MKEVIPVQESSTSPKQEKMCPVAVCGKAHSNGAFEIDRWRFLFGGNYA